MIALVLGFICFAFWLLPLVRIWCWFCFALCLISLTWWFAVCVNSVVTIAWICVLDGW